MKMLGEHRVSYFVSKPLMEFVWATSALVLWALIFQFVQQARRDAFINEVARIVRDDTIAILLHTGPWPVFQFVYVFIEFVRELLCPRCEFLPDDLLQIGLQC